MILRKKELAPVLLFVYNRPNHLERVIRCLKNNYLAMETELLVFSDGQKNEFEIAEVDTVRNYIHTIDGFKKVKIFESKNNKGLAKSIIQGVSQTIDQYGSVIVLEDDLETAPGFLTFMNEALRFYEDKDRIMQISGYMFDVSLDIESDGVFLPFTSSWGWATWKRAWDCFDEMASGYHAIEGSESLTSKFNLDGAFNYSQMMENTLNSKIDSWAIRWYLSVFLNNGLSLYPVQTLVKNIGFDGSGTHCATDQMRQSEFDYSTSGKAILNLPEVEINDEAFSRIKTFLHETGNSAVKKKSLPYLEKLRNLIA
jgi:glycosyltransferase involved in cell wall biosynthesis